jgi:ubiquinone/menaquinone biosynthesis C-methylase UbiE
MDNPAETYESYMVPVLFAPSAERLIELARLRAGERVLDVGCGTGIVARRAAPRVGTDGRVTGLDLSPGMLAVARSVALRERLSIDWREGRAEGLPFADGEFDVVLCQYALMFFVNPLVALNEMRRVLADGGRAVIAVWQSLDAHAFYQLLDRASSATSARRACATSSPWVTRLIFVTVWPRPGFGRSRSSRSHL